MKAAIVTIGTEILIGQILDTNSKWLGEKLADLGVDVIEKRSIADIDGDIKQMLDQLKLTCDLIITTGGLGPTKDDITKKSIGDYLNRKDYFEEALYNKIVAYFEKRGLPLTEAHKAQCYFPEGVVLLDNNLGTAPGMLYELKDGTKLISMPGVPYEMKYIFENGVSSFLKESMQDKHIYHRTLHTIGVGETWIAREISHIESSIPAGFSLAYLPSIGQVKVRVTGKGANKAEIESTVHRISGEIEEIIQEYVFGYDGIKIQDAIQKLFIESGKTLGLAESCTGGNVSHLITEIPGSSSYYKGSIVAYSYELKEKLLGVSKSTLDTDGAVSEECVKEMALGCIKALETDVAVAISGIAGPGGGTKEKKVGLVYMACTDGVEMKVRKYQLAKNRILNIQYASILALSLVRKLIKEQKNVPLED